MRVSSKKNTTKSHFTKCTLELKRNKILNLSHEEDGETVTDGESERERVTNGRGGGWLVDCTYHGAVRSNCTGSIRSPKTDVQRDRTGDDCWGVVYRKAVRETWARETFPRTRVRSRTGLFWLLPCSPGQRCSVEHAGFILQSSSTSAPLSQTPS